MSSRDLVVSGLSQFIITLTVKPIGSTYQAAMRCSLGASHSLWCQAVWMAFWWAPFGYTLRRAAMMGGLIIPFVRWLRPPDGF